MKLKMKHIFPQIYSIDICVFHFMAIGPFFGWDIANFIFNLPILVQCQGQIQWSHLRPKVQSICLHFVLWQWDPFGWDIGNSIFGLEIQGQGHGQGWPKSNQVIYRSGPLILPKIERNMKGCFEVNSWTNVCILLQQLWQHTSQYKSIKSTSVHRGVLINPLWSCSLDGFKCYILPSALRVSSMALRQS